MIWVLLPQLKIEQLIVYMFYESGTKPNCCKYIVIYQICMSINRKGGGDTNIFDIYWHLYCEDIIYLQDTDNLGQIIPPMGESSHTRLAVVEELCKQTRISYTGNGHKHSTHLPRNSSVHTPVYTETHAYKCVHWPSIHKLPTQVLLVHKRTYTHVRAHAHTYTHAKRGGRVEFEECLLWRINKYLAISTSHRAF